MTISTAAAPADGSADAPADVGSDHVGRRLRRRHRLAAGVVAASALFAAACSSGGETSTVDGPAQDPGGEDAAGEISGGEATTMVEAAAVLPASIATPSGWPIELVLFDRFAERSGIESPASFDGTDLSTWMSDAGEIPLETPDWGEWSDHLDLGQEVVDDFGYSWLELTSLSAGGDPATVGKVTVVTGGVDADAVDAAMTSAPGWSDLLERITVEGQAALTWNLPADGGERPDSPMNYVRADQWALVVPGRALFGFVAEEAFTDTVRANLGLLSTVADDEVLGPVVTELDEALAHKAMLQVVDGGLEPDPAVDEDAESTPLVPYEAVGIGAVVDDDGADLGVLVIANATAADAEANRDALVATLEEGNENLRGNPWAEQLSVASATTVDTLTVLTLTRADPDDGDTAYQVLLAVLVRGQNLFWVDEGMSPTELIKLVGHHAMLAGLLNAA